MVGYRLKQTAVLLLIALFSLTIAACNGTGGSNDSGEGLGDTWAGTLTEETQTHSIILRLAQSGAVVTGSYTLGMGNVTETGSIQGSFGDNTATLRFYVGSEQVGTLNLELDEDNATGTGTYKGAATSINLTRV